MFTILNPGPDATIPIPAGIGERPGCFIESVRASALLAPYTHPEVRAVGADLDPIFKAIVDYALAAR